jgi:hypothetical protein
MNEKLEAVSSALDALGAAIISGWSGEKTFCETWGWNCPAVTRHDAASIATSLAAEIRAANIEDIDSDTEKFIEGLPTTINVVQVQTIPQFWGSNNGAAYAAYIGTIYSIRASLHPLLGWKTIPDPKMLPGHTIRKLKSIQAEVDVLAPNKEQLQRQLEEIAQAHSVAENLPLDLKALFEARQKVETLAEAAEDAAKRIDASSLSVEGDVRVMESFAKDAEKLVSQCEDAYRITTTKGLAAAFDQRATRLGWTVFGWVAGLVGALAVGSFLGASRFETLTQVLSVPSPNWSAILLHAVFSVLSIGAPIWFAWLATKQIGQRFRLAEDYAFKASVAKAYEGYRREAARIDPNFEARLFSSALTRLEEAPLRLIESHAHGSPWHEMLSSATAQRTIKKIPEQPDVREASAAQLRDEPPGSVASNE